MARRIRRNLAVTVSMSHEENGEEIDLEIDCEVTPYNPGRSYGPPEKCFPPEGGDIESHEVYEVRGRQRIRREDLDDVIDQDQLAEAVTLATDDDGPDPDDAYERARERDW